jgi:hypothetical protein
MALAFEDGAARHCAGRCRGANSRDPQPDRAAQRTRHRTIRPARWTRCCSTFPATVRGRTITRDTLDAIAGNARIALDSAGRRRSRSGSGQPRALPAGVPGFRPGDAGRLRHVRHAAGNPSGETAMTIFSTSTSAFLRTLHAVGMTCAAASRPRACSSSLAAASGCTRSSDDPVAASRLRTLARADAASTRSTPPMPSAPPPT